MLYLRDALARPVPLRLGDSGQDGEASLDTPLPVVSPPGQRPPAEHARRDHARGTIGTILSTVLARFGIDRPNSIRLLGNRYYINFHASVLTDHCGFV